MHEPKRSDSPGHALKGLLLAKLQSVSSVLKPPAVSAWRLCVQSPAYIAHAWGGEDMKVRLRKNLTGTLHLEQTQLSVWVLWCWRYQHKKSQRALSLSVQLVILHSYSAACYVTPERICPGLCCCIYMRRYSSSKPFPPCTHFVQTRPLHGTYFLHAHLNLHVSPPVPRGCSLPPRLNAIPETTSCIQTSSLRPRPSDRWLIHPRLWPRRYTHISTRPPNEGE